VTRHVGFEHLIDDLKRFAAGGFPATEVRRYLAETLIDPAALESHLNYCDDHYTRNLVHKDRDFEILVICWGRGQKAPIHGHEGELCFARVERGKLRFSNYAMVSENPVRLAPTGDPVDGGIGFLDGPADIHAVENPREFGENAASLHIYSKPYAECDIFDSESGPRRRVKLAYDTIQGKPAERARG
jgi:predicted metal-dependent enzyme (double-stranded beta helix superfamily)